MSRLQALFKKYSNHQSTGEEQQLIHQWYDAYTEEEIADEFTIKQSIHNKLQNRIPGLKTPVIPIRRRSSTAIAIATAVAAIVIATIVSIALLTIPEQKSKPAFSTIASTTITRRVTLPDATQLLLQPHSQITFPTNFDQDQREVSMTEGEIGYQVTSDSKRPFIIKTGELSIKVLGTSFQVRALHNLQHQEIVVQSGRIAVAHHNKNGETQLGILTAGHRLLYNQQTGQTTIETNKQTVANKMQQGWLVLDNAPFSTLQALLSQRYGATWTGNPQALNNIRFTAAFPPQASLREIISILSDIYGPHFKIEEQQVIHLK